MATCPYLAYVTKVLIINIRGDWDLLLGKVVITSAQVPEQEAEVNAKLYITSAER